MRLFGASLGAFVDETHTCVDCGAQFRCKGRNAPRCVACRKIREIEVERRYEARKRRTKMRSVR
jgi:hypothetical protein